MSVVTCTILLLVGECNINQGKDSGTNPKGSYSYNGNGIVGDSETFETTEYRQGDTLDDVSQRSTWTKRKPLVKVNRSVGRRPQDRLYKKKR